MNQINIPVRSLPKENMLSWGYMAQGWKLGKSVRKTVTKIKQWGKWKSYMIKRVYSKYEIYNKWEQDEESTLELSIMM